MASKPIRILVLLYAAWWLGVFMPGHQRGEVKVAGAETAKACEHCVAPDGDDASQSSAPAESSACCAVCYLVAGLDSPPVFTFDVPTMGLLDELEPAPMTAQRPIAPQQTVLHGRAPPALRVAVI